ncbi:MAG TPA: tetratricopeptide repeat protein [bacterium]|nr:tetratricopeptide repeat protein [bacterium]HPN29834.1 tetratricopeptide repeat protein [bacterium]
MTNITYSKLKKIVGWAKVPGNDITIIESFGFKEFLSGTKKKLSSGIIKIDDSEFGFSDRFGILDIFKNLGTKSDDKNLLTKIEWLSSQLKDLSGTLKNSDYKTPLIQNLLNQSADAINEISTGKIILFEFNEFYKLDLFSYFIFRYLIDETVSFDYAFIFNHSNKFSVTSKKISYDDYNEKLFYILEYAITLKLWAKSAALVEKLLKLNRYTLNEQLKGRIFFKSAMVYVRRGLMKKAENYYLLSKQIFKKIGDSENWIKSTNSLGNIYITLEKYSEASDLFKQALSLSEEKQEDYSLSVIYGSMGNVQLKLENYGEAIDYLYKSLIFSARGGLFHNVQLVYGFLGEAYLGLHNYKKALYFFKTAYKFSCLEKSQINQGNNTMRIGKLYEIIGDINQCKDYYKKTLTIFKKINYLYGLMFLYDNYGDLYYKIKNKKFAEKYYESGLNISAELENKKMSKVIQTKIELLKNNGYRNEKR